MTEEEWQTGTNVSVLLECDLIRRRYRKFRLFACACAMNLTQWMTHPKALPAIERGYQFADGQLTPATLAKWHNVLNKLREGVSLSEEQRDPVALAHFAARFTCLPSDYFPHRNAWLILVSYPAAFDMEFISTMQHWGPTTLRDIFGNPFRPVTFSPKWRTDTAVSLAKQMYESREFGAMPILADALQDADCDNDYLLNHCRDANQVHVRGCWVVDLVLGKA